MVLEIQTEGTKVTGGVVCIDHCGRRDGDEELVAGSKFEQPSLVNRVQGVFGVWSPALGAHTFQELEEQNGMTKKIKVRRLHSGSFHIDLGKPVMLYLYGAWIGGFLVDALHQLVADAALVPVTRCWGRIPKIHLEVVKITGLGKINDRQLFLASSLKKEKKLSYIKAELFRSAGQENSWTENTVTFGDLYKRQLK